MTVPLLPAATLVVMRDGVTSGGGSTVARPEVLLVQRHGKSEVGAGAYVFPGGVVEDSDGSALAEHLSPALTAAQAQAILGDAGTPRQALAYYVAAIRETFEETLLLLAHGPNGGKGISSEHRQASGLSREELPSARELLHRNGHGFLDWLAEHGASLLTAQLVYLAHWVTPQGVPQRFDTRFFLARVERRQEIVPDSREIVDYRWIEPAEAVQEFEAGRLKLMAPTVTTLEWLTEFETAAAAPASLRTREVETIRPKLIITEDGSRRLIFPWDAEYVGHPFHPSSLTP